MREVWNWLDGKKTKLAALFFIVKEQVLPIWFPDGVPEDMERVLGTITVGLMFLGLGHGMVKGGKSIKAIAPVLLLGLLLVGCSKKVIEVDPWPEPEPAPVAEAPKPPVMLPVQQELQLVDVKIEVKETVIHFDFDDARLRLGEKNALAALAQTVKRGTVIRLTGGACPIGEEDYNLKLGYGRGYEVKKFLMDYCEIPGENIVVTSVGESELVTEDEAQYELNRRCEIVIGG